MFIPNHGGYGPSHDNVCSPHNCYVALQMVPGGHAPITLHVYRLVQKWLLPLGFHLYITT